MTKASNDNTVELPGGVPMPLLGFGTWQARGNEAYESVRVALETGYRHIDTATAYENEAQVGRAIRESGVPRDEIFVTTKLPPDHTGRERRTLDESLRALDLEYVDLWLIHWPPNGSASPQTWQELRNARDAGLTRTIGVSNYSTGQIDELISASGEAPAVNQIRWSPWEYDPKRQQESRERGVVLEGYSPFRASDLNDPVLAEVAAAHGVTPAQVVLRWHLEHGVVVIPKSATPERIRSNFDVFGFSLSPDEVSRIDGLAGA